MEKQDSPTTAGPPPIKVMLVDDHTLMIQGLARLLADQDGMEIVGSARSGELALELLAAGLLPDVVVMDVKMPGMGGIEATQRLREQFPDVNVVGMSSIDVGVIPSQMLSAGANAFITKSASIEELVGAIRKVHEGLHYVTPGVAAQLGSNPFSRMKRGRKVLFDRLSKRELQIAMLLSDGNKVSSIAELLDISPKTVYTYRYRIFDKLGIRNDVELTILAMKHGVCETSEDYINYAQQKQAG